MLKKTMTFEDYNGEKVTEDFYFSLSKAELIEMEMTAGDGGMSGMLAKIVAENDKGEILKTFREIILGAVGRRSEDGRRFIKNQQIRDEFEQTNAFSDLLVEFYTKPDAAAEFISGVVPGDLNASVAQAIAEGRLKDGRMVENVELPTPHVTDDTNWHDFSRDQLLAQDDAVFEKLFNKVNGPKPPVLLGIAMERKQRKSAGE